VISVEKGYDPREFVLFSFGGAGPMHAVFLASLLKIPKVIVPRNPGLLSALGMVMTDVIKDYSRTVMAIKGTTSFKIFSRLFAALEKKGTQDLIAEGFKKRNLFFERYADMRYEEQAYEIIVPFDKNFHDRFHQLHEKTYGYRIDEKAVQIVNIRLRAFGKLDKPLFQKASKLSKQLSRHAYLGERKVIFDHKSIPTQIILRDKLVYGNRIPGPAVVVEYSSTIVIPPFANGFVDEYGNIIIKLRA
jgi:N-methylhydantoinase A